ncbi:MAG: RNA-binding protein [Phycisphaeraceae bacterium]
MKIYVGNLSFQTTEDSLRDLFAQHGATEEIVVITDRETGRSRGFGFVTMPEDSQAQAAIEALNGTEFDGRSLTVNEARPRTERGGGGGGGGGRRDRW